MLSKSKYIAGLQCEKRLWLEVNQPEKASPISKGAQYRFDVGKQVELLARKFFTNGILIEADNIEKKIEQTQQSITDGASVIFGGTFLFDNVYIIADILQKEGDGLWSIIEVKSSIKWTPKQKPEYYPDLAIQKYVLQQSGLNIGFTKLMTLNKECIYPNLSELFTIHDVTNDVNAIVENISGKITSFQKIVKQSSEPEIIIGDHCETPHHCSFKEYCWKDVDLFSIFNIPRISRKKKEQLTKQGVFNLQDLPDNYTLTDIQQEFVQRILNKTIDIDNVGIQERLKQLQYPLHFLDFETDNPAIPRFDGFSPYEAFPFQYSCHIVEKNNEEAHFDFLHTDSTDPRLPLLKSLLGHIREQGSIIVYNAGTERGILKRLSETFPEYKERIDSMIERIWDLLELIRHCYKDYRFLKSNSLKDVLPVIVPELSYQQLSIQHGDDAQYIWNQLFFLQDQNEKQQLIDNLRLYCTMDTKSMVEIQKKLQSL